MIIKKFEEIVNTFGGKIAVKTDNRELTYDTLNASAHRTACAVAGEDGVSTAALLFEHGVDMIIGVLGALKAGKIYVPLDITYPVKRLVYMLENSESGVILTNSANLSLAGELAGKVERPLTIVNIDTVGHGVLSRELPRECSGDTIAYILYTSGSSGKPKGVVQDHRNVLYYIDNWTTRFSITPSDRLTLFSAFSHDGAGQDMFGALLNGATLYPRNIKAETTGVQLSQWVLDNKITIWHSVPTLYRYFVNTLKGREGVAFPDLRFILLGGEQLREFDLLMAKTCFPGIPLANVYGQTESSVSSIRIFNPGESFDNMSIGEPLDKTGLLLIDPEGGIVEDFGAGEIFVACEHIALGYWKDPERTKNVFLEDPGLGRLYRTGDLGKLGSGGQIEVMGREDSQLKIRGFRVESAEIETVLLKYDAIRDVVVVALEGADDEKYLCAYYVCGTSLGPKNNGELREYLAGELPDYMIPARFVQLEKMPLTPTNKIDRNALPAPEAASAEDPSYNAPRDGIEEKLIEIWADVLGAEKNTIGIDDNYFELGGHSLKATQLSSKIHKALDAVIPLKQIFDTPTVRGIAQYIKGVDNVTYMSIDPSEKREYYPLSSVQKRLYILQQMEPRNTGYNLPLLFDLEGELNRERLETVCWALIRRHESFRTSFELIGGEPVQVIREEAAFNIDYFMNPGPGSLHVDTTVGNFVQPFDLSRAPLLRMGVLKTGKNEFILMVDMHHIISDGTSFGIFEKDFMALYQGEELRPLPLQYKDFSQWQNSQRGENKIKKQEVYWLRQFDGDIPVLDLPTDFSRPGMQSFEGATFDFRIKIADTRRLKKMASEADVSLYIILLAGFNVFLSKISGSEDIIVGSPIAGRRHADLQKIVGMFVNTLVMRNHPHPHLSFNQFLGQVRERTLDAFENQEYQFEDLVEAVDVNRDVSRNPLFDVLFELQNVERFEVEIPGLKSSPHDYESKISKFDLTFQGIEEGETLIFIIRYSTKLFKTETIGRFAKYFKAVISSALETPGVRIADMDIIGEEERKQLLFDFNDTVVPYPKDKTIHRLFEEQVRKTPSAIAVHMSHMSHMSHMTHITYNELDKKSGDLAFLLREKGVNPGTIVALAVNRSMEMFIGLLGILKAGGAYLPMDPEYPRERIRYMLSDSGAAILLTTPAVTPKIEFEKEILTLDAGTLPDRPPTNPANPAGPLTAAGASGSAYLIYTSGSTGKPKGILIRHRNCVNFFKGITSAIAVEPGTCILALTTISFDIFVLETLLPLTSGLKVVTANEDQQRDPELLKTLIVKNGVDMLQITPSRLQLMVEHENGDGIAFLKHVKTVMVGGEAFPPNLFAVTAKGFNGRIYNMYGPTETTVWSAVKELTGVPPGEITIGKPIANTRIYILDKHGNIQPTGVFGELCIAGDGVAPGYINKPELTNSKFQTTNHKPPNVSRDTRPRPPYYRSGDLARWLPDGDIEFSGRIDHQVKIRGHRIELGEIENRLLLYDGIEDAVVIATEDKGSDRYLCAYVVYGNGYHGSFKKALDILELRRHLSGALPYYMVPSYFVELEKIPLTPNGKIDRKALPNSNNGGHAGVEYKPPANTIERQLVDLWENLLEIKSPGINDDFFSIGGNSMKLIRLHSRMNSLYSNTVKVQDLFNNRTIKELAGLIHEKINPGDTGYGEKKIRRVEF